MSEAVLSLPGERFSKGHPNSTFARPPLWDRFWREPAWRHFLRLSNGIPKPHEGCPVCDAEDAR